MRPSKGARDEVECWLAAAMYAVVTLYAGAMSAVALIGGFAWALFGQVLVALVPLALGVGLAMAATFLFFSARESVQMALTARRNAQESRY